MKRTEHRERRWKFPFVEYAPEQAEGELPLIIQLHGAGEVGEGQEDLKLVDVHGFSRLVSRQDFPCRFVMPQCSPDTFWAARVESLVEFVGQLRDEFQVDPDRIYLTGLSMGGYGTWYTAMARPDLFAAIAPVCGGGMAWNAGSLTMPVWAFHGAVDGCVNVRNSDEMVEALRALGRDVTYTRVEGCDHGVWEYAYNEALVHWFLSHSRKKA